ncbi:hypothetical protein [Thiobacter aerophilum]|uniref:Uncharacterized protein n=1 Tax=Thiobacter aerophilum TaxID=3121275 RepID=A0ABV0EEL4_9BURK
MKIFALSLLLLVSATCVAEEYHGAFDGVDTRAEGTRFTVPGQRLHLYATGAQRDVLLAGFFHKARLRVSYTPFPCGGGLTGTCGTVHGVAVDATDLR